MPPRREPPPLEETVATMVDTLTKFMAASSTNNAQILESQASSKAQLDIITQQLALQFEQTNALISSTSKPESSSKHPPPPPPPPPPNKHGLQIRSPKISLPIFDGSNPLDWLFQAEQYLTFYEIQPNQRLSIVAFHLSEDALSWYKYLFNNNLLTTWESFTRDLETRLGPSTYDNHQAALFKLRQTTTVTEYQTEFERLSNCITGLPATALLN